MSLVTLVASLLGNLLTGKGTIRTDEGATATSQGRGTIRADKKYLMQPHTLTNFEI